MDAKHPAIHVQLSGENGNVFNIIAIVSNALKRAGEVKAAKDFRSRAMAAKSYDEVLRLCIETVDVS